VAIATGALVTMVAFALAMQRRAEEPFHKMELLNRIDVLPRRQAETPSSENRQGGSAEGRRPLLDEAAVARVAALPGVLLAYPDYRLDRIQILRGGKPHLTSAIGLPREATRLRFVTEALSAGRFLDPSGGNPVILGTKLARDLGFASPSDAVGASLTLKAKGMISQGDQTFRLGQKQVEAVVVGVWDPPGGLHGFTADALVLPLDVIQTLPGVRTDSVWDRLWRGPTAEPGEFGRVVVRVRRPADLFAVEERIQTMGLATQTFLGRLKDMRTAFVLMDLVLTAVGTVALVVAGLGIINTQLMAVLERYREIGTYKALGASDGDVRVLFLAEAALVGVLGSLGGLLLAWVVSWAIELIVNAAARRQGIEESIMAFEFPAHLLGGAVLFAVVVSLLSGVYPAWRAARIDPIRALRSE
jgi:putative ABC transport system permease protein